MRNKNRDNVLPSSARYFERGMNGHNAVQSIVNIDKDIYLLKRTNNRSDLKILVADIYIAGEADIQEILEETKNIDCIVLIGFYNRYSSYARDVANRMEVGLFSNREFFGAVNFSGDKFIKYKPKPKEDE